jgi:hypothetical protein
MIREAMHYEKLADKLAHCNLCGHCCTISPDRRGLCGVRENKNGNLYCLVYETLIAEHIDPIEKNLFSMFIPDRNPIQSPRSAVILFVSFVRIMKFLKCRVPHA